MVICDSHKKTFEVWCETFGPCFSRSLKERTFGVDDTCPFQCKFIMLIFLEMCILLFQRNTKLKKRGFHTERFSYIVLKKGARDLEGQPWEKYLLRGGKGLKIVTPRKM